MRDTRVELSHMYAMRAPCIDATGPSSSTDFDWTTCFGDLLLTLAPMVDRQPACALVTELAHQWQRPPRAVEPVHGSATNIAGQGKANPIACILSICEALRLALIWARTARGLKIQSRSSGRWPAHSRR